MKIIKRTIAICLLGFALISCNTSAPLQEEQKKELPTYKIGYMICNSEKDTLDRFVPFTAYLSKKMGVNFEPVAIDTINFTREMENLDFTHTNSLLYALWLKNLRALSLRERTVELKKSET
jgi:phosphonate transport system substrate-binding protein